MLTTFRLYFCHGTCLGLSSAKSVEGWHDPVGLASWRGIQEHAVSLVLSRRTSRTLGRISLVPIANAFFGYTGITDADVAMVDIVRSRVTEDASENIAGKNRTPS